MHHTVLKASWIRPIISVICGNSFYFSFLLIVGLLNSQSDKASFFTLNASASLLTIWGTFGLEKGIYSGFLSRSNSLVAASIAIYLFTILIAIAFASSHSINSIIAWSYVFWLRNIVVIFSSKYLKLRIASLINLLYSAILASLVLIVAIVHGLNINIISYVLLSTSLFDLAVWSLLLCHFNPNFTIKTSINSWIAYLVDCILPELKRGFSRLFTPLIIVVCNLAMMQSFIAVLGSLTLITYPFTTLILKFQQHSLRLNEPISFIRHSQRLVITSVILLLLNTVFIATQVKLKLFPKEDIFITTTAFLLLLTNFNSGLIRENELHSGGEIYYISHVANVFQIIILLISVAYLKYGLISTQSHSLLLFCTSIIVLIRALLQHQEIASLDPRQTKV
jgi:hypothetical protein